MGRVARENQDGELLVYPLELPMYEGTNRELAQQSSVLLTSCLRHFAVVDALESGDVVDLSAGDGNDILNTEYAQATEQLIGTLINLVSMADNYGIDIMQEIFEVPWQV